jgi:hypothetical protein
MGGFGLRIGFSWSKKSNITLQTSFSFQMSAGCFMVMSSEDSAMYWVRKVHSVQLKISFGLVVSYIGSG